MAVQVAVSGLCTGGSQWAVYRWQSVDCVQVAVSGLCTATSRKFLVARVEAEMRLSYINFKKP